MKIFLLILFMNLLYFFVGGLIPSKPLTDEEYKEFIDNMKNERNRTCRRGGNTSLSSD